MKNLNNLVQAAYDIFAGHQPQTEIDACTFCCMTEEDAEALVTLPVDEIPLAVLRKYQDAATPDKLDKAELKYFAPRYLALIKNHQFPSFEPVLSLTRFGKLKEYEWTQEERQLLDEFALSFFYQYLQASNPKTEMSAMSVLLMFYKGKIDIQPLLGLWNAPPTKASQNHLQSLYGEIGVNKKRQQEVINAFADKGFSQLIINWLAKR